MKIENVRNGTFYLATARYNHNTLIITDVGTYGPLKVLAQKDKYFNSYEPLFMYFNGIGLKKITKATLKKDFQHALRTDPNYFTTNEREKLANMFKIKIILKPTLQEKKKKKVNVKKRAK
jgi:hypothetical protein